MKEQVDDRRWTSSDGGTAGGKVDCVVKWKWVFVDRGAVSGKVASGNGCTSR